MTGTGKQMLKEKGDISVTRVMKVIVRGRNSSGSEGQDYCN